MAEDIDVPKLGKINKKVLIPVVAVAAGFIGWRYWQARNNPTDSEAVDPGLEDPGTLPGVAGAVKPDNGYGSGNTGGSGGGSGQITTNGEWSQFVIEKLAGDRWTNSELAEALGNFLTDRPLSDAQQAIVRAGVAVAGYPPVGSHNIIPGGNTGLTVAPNAVTVSGITATTAMVNFLPVSGASTYRVYRSGASAAAGTGSSTPISLQGLTPGTSYTVTVSGVNGAGTEGPKSSPVTFKTVAAVAAKPAQPSVVSVTKDRATLRTIAVPNATSYKWYQNKKLVNSTSGPTVTLTNLIANGVYSVTVQSVTNTGAVSALSTAKSFRTAKK